MESNENNIKSIGFFTQMLVIFGVTTLMILGMGLLFGEEGKTYSTLFELGGQGISYKVLLQFFLSSIILSAIVKIFHYEKWLTNISFFIRTIIMLICIIAIMIVFIIVFDWFPASSWQGWIGFIISFGVCFGVATASMIVKKKKEDKRYEELLEEYKKRQGIERK